MVNVRNPVMTTHQDPVATLSRRDPFASLFQEISEIAQAALRRSSYFELRDISCDFSGGILTLQGRVPSYHLKQLAQASVADVPGVVEVHNRVEVVMPRLSPNSGWRERETLAST
jgi:osmotically-inducible protein OsmY